MKRKNSPYIKGSPQDVAWRLRNKIIPDMEQLLRDKESCNDFNPNFRECPLDTGAERMHIRAAKACADQIERDGYVDRALWNKYMAVVQSIAESDAEDQPPTPTKG